MHVLSLRRPRPAFPRDLALLRRLHLRSALLFALAAALLPARALACACGCGIAEVGTGSMLPTGSGITAFIDYDYQDQDRNWSGGSQAPAADNSDKDIRTSWVTFGYRDMFNRSWGLRLDVPYEMRHFETESGGPGGGLAELNYSGFGDIRIEGLYTGLSPDLSSGLTFGVKLPTGSYTFNDAYGDIDRDTEIGSGSTDLLVGGYRRFNVGTDYGWSGIAQAVLDIPVLTRAQYRPGSEFDGAFGVYYNGWSMGRMLVSPIAQLKVSVRGADTGANATFPVASGFSRLLFSPGIEFDLRPVKVYADIELPLYQHFTGNQVAAPVLVRLSLSCRF
jgi:hypothetical protein